MVIQKTVDNLKERPKDERRAVAGGVAIFVVIVLLIGWGIWFFKRVQSGAQQVELNFGSQNEFNFSSVKDAQEQLQQTYQNVSEDLKGLPDQAASQQLQGQPMQVQEPQPPSATDQFGIPNN